MSEDVVDNSSSESQVDQEPKPSETTAKTGATEEKSVNDTTTTSAAPEESKLTNGTSIEKPDGEKSTETKESKMNSSGKGNKNSDIFPVNNPLEPVPEFLRVVEGIDKLRRAIGKELINGNADEKSSNLPQLLSIAQCLLKPSSVMSPPSSTSDIKSKSKSSILNPPSAVLKPFTYVPKKTKKKVRFVVDIVSADGDEWSKVSARNPRSLALLAIGEGGYLQKSMLDHAKDYKQCAEQNLSFFKPPRIKFIFTSGIGTSLCEKLIAFGIIVEGKRIDDSVLDVHPRIKPYKELFFESESSSEEGCVSGSGGDAVDGVAVENGHSSSSPKGESGDDKPSPKTIVSVTSFSTPFYRNPSLEGITKLNLDITAILAYISNITNGYTNVSFRSKLLNQQLEFERKHPQKPILESIFRGRELYCCQTAYKEFTSILTTVGGLQEQRRAKDFLRYIKVVPDQISERTKQLKVTGNIKLRSVTIFGTGDSIQAVTVSANSGFLRSAKSQGLEFPCFLHESRALTEEKENLKALFLY